MVAMWFLVWVAKQIEAPFTKTGMQPVDQVRGAGWDPAECEVTRELLTGSAHSP